MQTRQILFPTFMRGMFNKFCFVFIILSFFLAFGQAGLANNPPVEEILGPDYLAFKANRGDKEAIISLEKMASLGDINAQLNLGKIHYYGWGVPKDFKEAHKWYLKVAEQGDIDAQMKIAHMYTSAKGVSKDLKEAHRWHLKAAEQGNGLAQYFVGADYDLGEGTIQDYRKAHLWYLKAANQGVPAAEFALGLLYENGDGVLKDYTEAYKWFNLSARWGKERAAKRRDNLEKLMTPEQIAEGQHLSREWTRQHKIEGN